MSNISELLRQLAYYKAGGGKKESIQEVFEGINNLTGIYSNARKNYLENEKATLENQIKRRESEQGKSINFILGIPQEVQNYNSNIERAKNNSFAGVQVDPANKPMFTSGLNEDGVLAAPPTFVSPKTEDEVFKEKTGLPSAYKNLTPEQISKMAQAQAMLSSAGQRQAGIQRQYLNPATGEISATEKEGFLPASSKDIFNFFKNKNGQEPAAFLDQSTGNISKEPTENSVPITAKDVVTLQAAKLRAGGNLDFTGKELVKNAADELPKLKIEANSAVGALRNIEKMEELINTSNVTGKIGQLKAFLAPYAEAVGLDSKNLSDAQTFQLFARAAVGPQRLNLIGPGAVTTYEQELLNKLSGGGGASKEAALELMNYYKNMNLKSLINYNQTLQGISAISPAFGTLYKPINYQRNNSVPAAPRVINPNVKPPAAQPKKSGQSADDILKEFGL